MGDISQLPECIIHHILSNLKTKEAARTSIFCKTWYSAWLTCPTLNFDESADDSIYNSETRGKLLKFIKNILQRYQDQKIRIVQLILPHILIDSYSAEKWIEIAVESGVERLELKFYVSYDRFNQSHKYTLPRTVFEAKTLRELIVHGTNVFWRDDKIMFNHLQKLHLFNIYIDDDIFQGILTRCPLINNLNVSSCDGLERIKVTKLHNLRKFTVCALGNQHIEIDAPHLQYLDCNLNWVGTLDLYTTEKLKYFSLAGTHPSAIFLDNFMHKFPQVEDLRLPCCCGVERINISSHSLKRIMLGIRTRSLKSFTQVREVKIDAPSMVSLELEVDHDTVFFPDLSLTNAPSQFVSKISMSNIYRMNTYELKKFLAKLIQSKVSLVLRFNSCQRFFEDFEYVRQIPIYPVVEVEDLDLCFGSKTTSTSAHSNFLKGLLMTYHPKAITMHRSDTATEFLYKKLIIPRAINQDLKEVIFEIYDEIKHEWLPSDWNNMQKAPRSWDRVRFRLEWESHLHN